MSESLFLEDLPVGRSFRSRRLVVDTDAVLGFAHQFDPQPFHTDPAAAGQSIFGRLAASGWHTAALSMRLLVETLPLAGGVIGAGLDELRWPKPVYPGDALQVEIIVLEARASRSNPAGGWLKLRITTTNQDGEAVQVAVPNVMAIRRPSTAATGEIS